MAAGSYVGSKLGSMVGSMVNNDNEFLSGVGDGPTGNVLAPMTGATFLAATGRTPTNAYTCQEGSGNLIDQIGTAPLTPLGGPTYQVIIPGWTRRGVGFNETLNQRFSTGTGTGPNPLATPMAMLVYFTSRAPAAIRPFCYLTDAGASARVSVHVGATGLLRSLCGTGQNDGVIGHNDGNMHVCLQTVDNPGTISDRFTDLELDNGTFGTGVQDGPKGLGAYAGATSHLGEIAAMWWFSGADAQFTTAQARTFLQSLGWVIPW